jgi:hypothetical protein
MTLFDIYMFQQLLVTNTSRTIMTGVYLLTLTFLFMKIYQGQFENDMESHIFFETQYYFEKKIFEDVFIIEQCFLQIHACKYSLHPIGMFINLVIIWSSSA